MNTSKFLAENLLLDVRSPWPYCGSNKQLKTFFSFRWTKNVWGYSFDLQLNLSGFVIGYVNAYLPNFQTSGAKITQNCTVKNYFIFYPGCQVWSTASFTFCLFWGILPSVWSVAVKHMIRWFEVMCLTWWCGAMGEACLLQRPVLWGKYI